MVAAIIVAAMAKIMHRIRMQRVCTIEHGVVMVVIVVFCRTPRAPIAANIKEDTQ